LLAGFLGGLSLRQSEPHLARLAAEGIQRNINRSRVLVASATMFVRVLVLAAVLKSRFSKIAKPAHVSHASMAFCCAALNTRKSEHASARFFQTAQPVELGQALQFGLLLALIILATHAARAWLGEAESICSPCLGIADVDAITISMSRLGLGEVSIRSAAIAVLAATMVNTLTKVLCGNHRWRETRHRHCRAHRRVPVDRLGARLVVGLAAYESRCIYSTVWQTVRPQNHTHRRSTDSYHSRQMGCLPRLPRADRSLFSTY